MGKVLPVINTVLASWPLLDPVSYERTRKSIHKAVRSFDIEDVDVSRPVWINGVFISGGSKDEVIEALHQFNDGTYGPVGYYGSVFYSKFMNFNVAYYDVVSFNGPNILLGVNTDGVTGTVVDGTFQSSLGEKLAGSYEKKQGAILSYHVAEAKDFSQLATRLPIYQKTKPHQNFGLLTTGRSSVAVPIPALKTRAYVIFSLAPGEILVVKGGHNAYKHMLHSYPPYSEIKSQLKEEASLPTSDYLSMYQDPLPASFSFANLTYYQFGDLCPYDAGDTKAALSGRRHVCIQAESDDESVLAVVASRSVVRYKLPI